MKYLFIVLLAFGSCLGLSAQQRDRGGFGRIIYTDNTNRNYGDEHSRDINRSYDRRVWEVQNDYSLPERRKRKMIREINEEREDRLKAAKRWERKSGRTENRWERRDNRWENRDNRWGKMDDRRERRDDDDERD
ncbi:MAG: hypothetical protein NVSMB67_13340 [Flavisolibacter sp.]